VHGLWRTPLNRAQGISVSLLPLYPAIDPATQKKTPMIAWNIAVNARGVVKGNTNSKFTVPTDARNVIEMAVERRSEAKMASAAKSGGSMKELQAAASDPSAILTLGLRDAPIALNRGTYFIALRDSESQQVPDWSSIRVGALKDDFLVLRPNSDGVLETNGFDPIRFDYIAVSIEPYGVATRAS
jgi:hypothetical protein